MITSMPLSSSPNKQPLSSATSYSSSSASSSPVHSAASPTTLKDGMMHHQNQSHHPLTERCSDTNVNHGHRKRRKKGSSTWKDPTVSPAASTTLHGDQQRSCSFSQHSQPPSSSSTTHLIPITPPPPLSVATPTSALAPAPSQQQHISTAVRTYYEVDKDRNGNYILPVEIDSWTVIDLGTVVYDRPAYHNQRYIYPVNYTVKKWYRSMIDPQSDTQYTCRILDNGREPKFEVTADDCDMTYSGPTPTTVWTIIVRRAFSIRNQEYGHNPVGPDFFGLRKNTIAKMIQDLPNASQCSRYVWQNFEPAKFNKPGSRTRRRTESSSGKGLQHPYGLVKEGATATTTTREGDDLSSTNMSYRHRPITCIAAASLSTLTGGLNYGLTHGHRSSQQQTASNTIKRGKKN
ncbi:F/Y-rich N-terminus-domain-containing protein [Mycotypha africana]|uniref:F/Y-rich N-terminus-domain-containing protein n=1 Tax=Mycotypha africana TaxID=64632 RepID=UPI0023001009|nr:F/Y-rich N-terminus-domain-containing protein [Mycotypha africana]KAI8987455.1 F/Y-rich N-terminus-domain-containing protein [Mycotypha africana]